MHHYTSTIFLRHLVQLGHVSAQGRTFTVQCGMNVSVDDTEEAFISLLNKVNNTRPIKIDKSNNILVVKLYQHVFDRIFKILYEVPDGRSRKKLPEYEEFTPVLPSIFIGNEKTQIRQIPLVDGPPYPFRFLLELGGMIVLKRPKDPVSVTMALRQFLNNHPQYRPRIAVHECPDDTVVLYTYYIETVESRRKARQNLNVPEKGQHIE